METPVSTADRGWMELLLDDAPLDELETLRRTLIDGSDPSDRATVEREATAALRLRAQLDQRRQRSRELAALNDIAVRLTTVRDDRALLQEVVDQARQLLGVDLAYMGSVYDEEFVIEVTSGALTPNLVGIRLALDEGLVGLIVRRSAPEWTPDYQSEPAFRHITGADSAARSENMRGLLGVPLRVADRVIGALFACKRQERAFTETEIALLSALAAHAAIAIENVRSLERDRDTVARLEAVNAELSQRTNELEQILQWDRTLTQVVLLGAGVQRLVQEVAQLSRQPAYFVLDESALPAELMPHADDVTAAVRELRAGGKDHVARRGVLAQRVAAAGEMLGALLSLGAEQPTTRLLLERAAPAIALSLAGERAAGEATRRARDAFLVDLLTHPAAEQDERRQLRLAGLTPDTPYCIAVAIAAGPDTSIRAALENVPLPAGSVAAEHGSRALAVVPAKDSASVQAVFASARLDATIGIAEPARGAKALARAYVEAQQTVDVLDTLGRSGEVSSARGLGIYRILLSHLAREHLDELTEAQLGPLMAEQSTRGVPLLETLSEYLAHGRHHAATASSLGVHVNTLYQRLDAIDRLLGPDWRDPDKALDLQVLMRLRRTADLLGARTR
ncbi:Regulator of polyketide synthase expression [Rhodococcus wratislaviensis]|uniref:Regulator of polyketide synthase expression n=1 Tax=Rhodococcus wratislaviensis TaxID=44752 RepID=A0A402C6C0_RHOWR|nr:GAF domain-containing protein [Rhodococcus wratislaviensis]GCE39123.1 Regulator of polyketide synthase expression [Rhodococcus wratislaviensis]